MKLKPTTAGFLIALFSFILSLAAYFLLLKKKNYFYIDNPTEQLLQVDINGNAFNISPQFFTQLKLEKGRHHLKVKKLNIDTVFHVNDFSGLLNPHRKSYIIYEQLYGYAKNRDSLFTSDSIVLNKQTFYGKSIQTKALYIEGFYYGLDQNFATIVHQDSLGGRTKIFREKDFIDYYNTH